MTELTEILDELKTQHGTDAATARAAGLTKAAVSHLRLGKRALGLRALCGLLRATAGNRELQTRLLQVTGLADAMLEGRPQYEV